MYNFLYLVIVVLFGVFGEQNSQLMNDKVALLSFMSEIVSDPGNVLENWNSSGVHVCNWARVSCNNASDSVTELILNATRLGGTISPSLANLSSLTVLDLSMNFFEGPIPKELGSLSQLKQLSLSWNFLEGKIPYHLGFLHNMEYLDLGSNKLQGEIPESLFCNGSLSLRYIDLSNNSLSGEIPFKNECGLKNLSFLLLWSNRLVGHIPRALSNSTRLKWLDLESNMFTGELPSEIVREMPKLQILYLSYNHFVSHGGNNNLEPFFASLVNCSDLKELKLAGNNLGGEIPPIVGDLSTNLLRLILSENLIHGFIPPPISNLANLTLLNLSSNLLNGSIPPELCRMGKLERVYLSNNSLSGEIPPVLGYVPHLGLLDLSRNKLSGPIPDSLANLPQLRSLILYQNQLTGTIPPSLGQCVNLEILDLSHNKISGVIPSEVAGLRSLKLYLNLSSNHLYGPLPLELSKMDMVLAIDLSYNNLIGTIPTQLKSCISLESLNLSHNFLEGPLPFSIGQLPYLRALDVSSNQLIGEIPQSLPMSSTLKRVNFSFNQISGKVSNEGAFSLLTIDSFLGNDGLCGSIEGMPKLVKGGDESANVKETISVYSTNGLLCGSVGYIAPEYGLGSSASPKGDVYGFGVLLLEIVTGRRPTEVLIDEGSSLHEWFKSHFPHKLDPIVEHALDRCTPSVMPKEYTKIWRDVILEMIELGLMCTQFTPSTRPTMLDVAHEMGRLKDYLSNPSSLLIKEKPPNIDGV
nr:putative leucine-rich repeat receptor-like serine/threonine-protein kinase [Quercus suber]